MFLLGALTCAAVLFLIATWPQWTSLPRLWRSEPDCSLRSGLAMVRRTLRGARHARCSLCGQSHLLSNDHEE